MMKSTAVLMILCIGLMARFSASLTQEDVMDKEAPKEIPVAFLNQFPSTAGFLRGPDVGQKNNFYSASKTFAEQYSMPLSQRRLQVAPPTMSMSMPMSRRDLLIIDPLPIAMSMSMPMSRRDLLIVDPLPIAMSMSMSMSRRDLLIVDLLPIAMSMSMPTSSRKLLIVGPIPEPMPLLIISPVPEPLPFSMSMPMSRRKLKPRTPPAMPMSMSM